MKVVTEETQAVVNAGAKPANGMMRVYNQLDGSYLDVHTVDGKEYVKYLPHLWSSTPVVKAPIAPIISKEQAVAEDAVIVSESATKKEIENLPEVKAELETAAITEDKPVSARSRKLAKFED
jgi:hypothetical protein